MGLKISVEPSEEPVTKAEAKDHLRVDITDDDTYIDALVKSARIWAEDFTRRSFVTQTWILKADAFPIGNVIYLPSPPLSSITSIKYIDTAGTTQTWASSKYDVDTDSEPGRIVPAFGEVWPTTRLVIDAVTITFDTGYGAASSVPEDIKHAIKFLVGHWYENREEVVVGTIAKQIPQAAKSLLWNKRILEAA